MSEYKVSKQRDWTDDDGLSIDLGPAGPKRPWWELDLPPCPDCGGHIIYWEDGCAPGTHRCMGQPVAIDEGHPLYHEDNGCGSLFSIDREEGRIVLRRERVYY